MAYNVAIIMLTTLLIGTANAQAPPPLFPPEKAPGPLGPMPPMAPGGPGPMPPHPTPMSGSHYGPAPSPSSGKSPSPTPTATSPTTAPSPTPTGAKAPAPSAAVSNGVAAFGTFAVGLLVISLVA